ncbi:hypothetical protein ACFQJ5_14710 [Halomicroarcula sp. GCM10025324]|uniref:hypothetical protein n=1 Tax=Haloarcula TaxID=2237 RepID=UPI0023E8CF12|nr:hypothetical protein [Halomicroarcula sp. ZS-22-S1]
MATEPTLTDFGVTIDDTNNTKNNPTPAIAIYSKGNQPYAGAYEAYTYARDKLDRTDFGTDDEIQAGIGSSDPGQLTVNAGVWSDTDSSYPEYLHQVIDTVTRNEVPHVIAPHLSAFGDSYRDIHEVVKTLANAEVTTHVVREELIIEPGDGELNALRAVAESERRDALNAAERRLQTQETGEWIGRPPIGFTVEDGVLVPADGYDELVAALEQVDKNPEKTVYWASKVTSHSRDSLRRALNKPDRRELYGLDGLDTE